MQRRKSLGQSVADALQPEAQASPGVLGPEADDGSDRRREGHRVDGQLVQAAEPPAHEPLHAMKRHGAQLVGDKPVIIQVDRLPRVRPKRSKSPQNRRVLVGHGSPRLQAQQVLRDEGFATQQYALFMPIGADDCARHHGVPADAQVPEQEHDLVLLPARPLLDQRSQDNGEALCVRRERRHGVQPPLAEFEYAPGRHPPNALHEAGV